MPLRGDRYAADFTRLPSGRSPRITPLTLSDADATTPPPPPRARPWRRRGLFALAVTAVVAGGAAVYTLSDPGRRQLILPTGPKFPYSTTQQRTPDRLRVLFLGNSFTQFNGGLALVLQRLAESAGKQPPPVFDQLTRFGATWAELWSLSDALATIRQGHWDYVVLQDYSRAAMIYRTEMDQYGKRFSTEIRAAGAKPLFFMTWARKDEMSTQRLIAGAYANVAAANGAAMVPVGTAWETSLRNRPWLILHTADKKHPTPAGSYLTACVFYAVLYHQSPRGLTARIDDGKTVYISLTAADAAYLQDVAWRTVTEAGRVAATRPTSRPSTTRATTRSATQPTTRKDP